MAKPTGPHTDWKWPFNKIPRGLTAVNSDSPPRQITGNIAAGTHVDIPPIGSHAICWPPYVVVVSDHPGLEGLYFHGGIRYDYNGHYYEIGVFKIGVTDGYIGYWDRKFPFFHTKLKE